MIENSIFTYNQQFPNISASLRSAAMFHHSLHGYFMNQFSVLVSRWSLYMRVFHRILVCFPSHDNGLLMYSYIIPAASPAKNSGGAGLPDRFSWRRCSPPAQNPGSATVCDSLVLTPSLTEYMVHSPFFNAARAPYLRHKLKAVSVSDDEHSSIIYSLSNSRTLCIVLAAYFFFREFRFN